jgi:hypothetical protein
MKQNPLKLKNNISRKPLFPNFIITLLLIALFSTVTHAKKVALLVETASGSPIYSELDIITIKKLLGKEFEITTFNSPQATSTNIRNFLKKMSKLSPNSTFVFYYSGHGHRFKKDRNSKEKDKQDDFLITSDVECNNNIIDNVLVDNELNHLYAQIPAKKVIIIDACHSHTMYKGIHGNRALSKLYKNKSNNCNSDLPFTKGSTIPNYTSSNIPKIIHLGASNENESAEGSDEGGVFTLALKKALKEKGDISFMKLLPTVRKNIKPIATRVGAEGAFTPSFTVNGLSSLTTKDIFVIAKPRRAESRLKDFLNSKKGGINLRTQTGEKRFSLDTPIVLKAKVANSNKHYYLIDMLDKNSYKLLTKNRLNQCILNRNRRYCQFQNLIASSPFGESNIYMIITPKPLSNSVTKTNRVLRGDALMQELKEMSIEVGKISFEVYPL